MSDWTADAWFVEYSRAADPIATGALPPVRIRTFSSELHQGGDTRIVALDLSSELADDTGGATRPGLLASFVCMRANEHRNALLERR